VSAALKPPVTDAIAEMADHGAAFEKFLGEIHDHFVHVVGERLEWQVLERPSYTVGNGNVVLRFRTAQGLFLFRVPRFSQLQLRSLALARLHFGELGLMPELVYRDGKCEIERYMRGLPLSAGVSDETLQGLARQLAAVHQLPAMGCGRLVHGRVGTYADVATWLAETPVTVHSGRRHAEQADAPLDAEETEAAAALSERMRHPPPQLLQAPCVVCHGDLWRENIVVGPEGETTLIDWDMLGAYPREADLVLLVNADLDARQKALFLQAYGHPVDAESLQWWNLRRMARDRRMRLRDKLERMRRHGLLG
jgi:hypothetical protein